MQAAMYYPNEFDGIIAGNPGFRLSKAAIGETWDNNQFLKYAPTDKNGNKIVADGRKRIWMRLLKVCLTDAMLKMD